MNPRDALTNFGLPIFGQVLADFESHDLDAYAITTWANHPDENIRRRRQRFLVDFPVFVPMLVFHEEDPFNGEITGWIDGGEPLIANIAGLLSDASHDTVRFLQRKPLSLLGSRWTGKELELAFALECLPPDARPQSEKDWKIFGIYEELLTPLPGSAYGQVFRELCSSGYQKSWDEMLSLTNGCFWEISSIARYSKALVDGLTHLAEEASAGHRNVDGEALLPLPRKTPEALANDFVSDYSPAELLAQASSWKIACQEEFERALQQSNDPELIQWPGLLRKPFTAGGYHVTSLITIDALLDVSSWLRPYVSRIGEAAALGDSHFLALRDLKGQLTSVAEISLQGKGGLSALPACLSHTRTTGELAYQEEADVLDAVLESLSLPEQQEWLAAINGFHQARRDKIQEKLSYLRNSSVSATLKTLRRAVPRFNQRFLEPPIDATNLGR